MTKEEVLEAVAHQDHSQRLRWLLTLGWELTIAARDSYPVEPDAGHTHPLVAFNELQHQIYNFVRHISLPNDWPLDKLAETLFQKARYYGVEAGLNWALENAMRNSQDSGR